MSDNSEPMVITLLSEKGGVGKTFLARELVASFERTGEHVSLVNIDPQYPLTTTTFDAPIVVLDTPGYISRHFDALCEVSDVVVVPVRPTRSNIQPFCRIVDMVRERTDVPLVIVVNGWNRFKAAGTWFSWLRAWLKDEGVDTDSVYVIPQSEAIAAAELADVSVADRHLRGYARGVAGCVMAVINEIRAAAGFDADDVLSERENESAVDEVLSVVE